MISDALVDALVEKREGATLSLTRHGMGFTAQIYFDNNYILQTFDKSAIEAVQQLRRALMTRLQERSTRALEKVQAAPQASDREREILHERIAKLQGA